MSVQATPLKVRVLGRLDYVLSDVLTMALM